MTSKERIFRQLAGEPVDHIPLIGGWALGARNIAEIAGISIEDYQTDPLGGVLAANHALCCDGLVPPAIPDPANLDENHQGEVREEEFAHIEPEALLEYAEQIPDTEERVLAERFNEKKFEANLNAVYDMHQKNTKGFTLIPNDWGVSANFTLFAIYGYQAFLEAIAFYPEAVEKIFWESAVIARRQNQYHIEMIKKHDLPRMMFTGHDICNQMGPMCSPKYLKKSYWPHSKYALEPFVNEGIRLIHHCDGNVMPIIDDMIDAGYTGFQGFQYECGVDPYELAKRRGPNGETMLFMAGLSITRTLPFGTPQEAKDEIDYCMDYTDGGKGLFLFTSNVVGIEVPPINLKTAYHHAASIDPSTWQPKQRPWPWSQRQSKTLLN
ncbi:uroporphyrinogen decarboxylase/cobalamine-independent methonine synthase family protein [Tichowtungia aerotolerans]|uniref:Uncharacterized protein n=1 Tax=Tichowtungia aerotolerans TaxID=2697043 RepID=A0A6P1M805_9BACT|nr:uroporphyrinogen decarboxylase family protein [Tichowtungia aerotolerans]QHI70720.1 hypothetical protein GT409_15155 [Tichowtungia aerotolerans]